MRRKVRERERRESLGKCRRVVKERERYNQETRHRKDREKTKTKKINKILSYITITFLIVLLN